MIAVLITARMGSSRLPKKHLIEANKKPLLYWLIKRFEFEFEKEIVTLNEIAKKLRNLVTKLSNGSKVNWSADAGIIVASASMSGLT